MISLKVKNNLICQKSFLCDEISEVFAVHVVQIKDLGQVTEHDAFKIWIQRFPSIIIKFRIYDCLTPKKDLKY